MNIGFIIIGVFAVAVGFLIFSYEQPKKNRQKMTGRGGDFES
jgi:hypothetical protein